MRGLKYAAILCIFVTVFVSFQTGVSAEGGINLLKNPGFEEDDKKEPAGWSRYGGTVNGSSFEVMNKGAHSGNACLLISNQEKSDTMVMQELKVEKGAYYKVSCWIYTEGIESEAGSANISLFYVSNGPDSKGIYTSEEFYNTEGKWRPLQFYIKTKDGIDEPLKLALRLGGQGIPNKGKVYFDDIEFVKVDKPAEDFFLFDFSTNIGKVWENYSQNGIIYSSASSSTDIASSSADTASSSTKKWFVYGGIGILGIGGLVAIDFFLTKRKKKVMSTQVKK